MVPQALHMRVVVPHVLVQRNLLLKYRARDLVSLFVHLVNNQRAHSLQDVRTAPVME